MSEITFEVDNGEDEPVQHKLVARYALCDDCGGEGTHLTPSIREHAYSQEEMEEEGPEFLEQYLLRGGIYDVTCLTCKGLRVVLVPDEDASDPATLAIYRKQESDKAHEAQVRAAELRMGC